MHALSFFKVWYLVYFILFFYKNVPISEFLEKKNPPLLYATDKLGEMALAYLKSLPKKKHA